MSVGTTRIAATILAVDRGSYSHAALWSGDGVIESVLRGVNVNAPVGDRDVYRYRGPNAPLPNDVAERIVQTAQRHDGLEYAFTELYLLGVLFALGLRPDRSLVGLVLEAVAGEHANALEDWLSKATGECVPRVCTELVAYAYYAADDWHSYAFRLAPRSQRPAPALGAPPPPPGLGVGSPIVLGEGAPSAVSATSAATADDLETVAGRLTGMVLDAVGRTNEALPPERKALMGSVAFGSDDGRPFAVVTPSDLQFSPSLTFVGRIQE